MAGSPLWKCPKCGQRFVTRNMWHSCVRRSTADFFGDRDPRLKALYTHWLRLVRRFGPVTVNVNKTRISFQGRVRFAGVARTTRNALVCSFWLKRRIQSPRFERVERIPPNNYVYQFKLTDQAQLDVEVEGWLREAYKVGVQKAGGPPAPKRGEG
jgi:uncharacterized C2H2 Zn-finger protein